MNEYSVSDNPPKCLVCNKKVDTSAWKYFAGISLYQGPQVASKSIPLLFHLDCFEAIVPEEYAVHLEKERENSVKRHLEEETLWETASKIR